MDFISIDLISPFEATTKVNQYTLTMIYMLTIYIICIPITDKSADTVVNAYLKEVYCRFRGSWKILSDNVSELKKLLFSEVSTQIRIKHLFSSPYWTQVNGHIEASHKLLKNCIRKFTMKGEVLWDEVPKYSMHFLHFLSKWTKLWISIFLMFGKHVCIFIWANLLQPKMKYLGHRPSLICIEMLRVSYMLAAINLKKAIHKQPIKKTKKNKIQGQKPCVSKETTRDKLGILNICQTSVSAMLLMVGNKHFRTLPVMLDTL